MTPSTSPVPVMVYTYVPGFVIVIRPVVFSSPNVIFPPSADGFVRDVVSGRGVPSSAVRVNVNSPVISAGFSPSGTERIFSTGIVIFVTSVLYVFVNVRGLSVVDEGVAVSVPSPLSTTSIVTFLPVVAAGSFVTPSTVPDSVTVYSYVPGFVNSKPVNVTVSTS